jgi:hypothetical protein
MSIDDKITEVKKQLAGIIVQIPAAERKEKILFLLDGLREELRKPFVRFLPTAEQRIAHLPKLAGQEFSVTMKGNKVSFVVTPDGKFTTPIGVFDNPSAACMKQWGDGSSFNGWVAKDNSGKKLDIYICEYVLRAQYE